MCHRNQAWQKNPHKLCDTKYTIKINYVGTPNQPSPPMPVDSEPYKIRVKFNCHMRHGYFFPSSLQKVKHIRVYFYFIKTLKSTQTPPRPDFHKQSVAWKITELEFLQ